MTNEGRDHLKTFVERPYLRPYFLRLPMFGWMDSVLTYAAMSGQSNAIAGWKNAFASAFRNSTILCGRLRETESSYPNAGLLLVAASCAPTAGAPK